MGTNKSDSPEIFADKVVFFAVKSDLTLAPITVGKGDKTRQVELAKESVDGEILFSSLGSAPKTALFPTYVAKARAYFSRFEKIEQTTPVILRFQKGNDITVCEITLDEILKYYSLALIIARVNTAKQPETAVEDNEEMVVG